MYALIILIVLGGQSTPYPYLIQHHPTIRECEAATRVEVPKARAQHTIYKYGCVKLAAK